MRDDETPDFATLNPGYDPGISIIFGGFGAGAP